MSLCLVFLFFFLLEHGTDLSAYVTLFFFSLSLRTILISHSWTIPFFLPLPLLSSSFDANAEDRAFLAAEDDSDEERSGDVEDTESTTSEDEVEKRVQLEMHRFLDHCTLSVRRDRDAGAHAAWWTMTKRDRQLATYKLYCQWHTRFQEGHHSVPYTYRECKWYFQHAERHTVIVLPSRGTSLHRVSTFMSSRRA